MNLTISNNSSHKSQRFRENNYFYIVSVGCLNCGRRRMLTEISVRYANLNGRTMQQANLVADDSLISQVYAMPPCPTCRTRPSYDHAQTEFRLHRNSR